MLNVIMWLVLVFCFITVFLFRQREIQIKFFIIHNLFLFLSKPQDPFVVFAGLFYLLGDMDTMYFTFKRT